jgi:hypothetical protein
MKPLVSDIQTLVDHVGSVDKTAKKIYALNNKKGIHSKVKAGSDVKYSKLSNHLVESGIGTIRADVERITSGQKWATTRWSADPDKMPPSTHEEILAMARRAAFGLDVSVDTIYNGIPWSWLVDWCGNMGDYISTFRNTIPAKHSKVCVMTHTKTTYSAKVSAPQYPDLTGKGDFNISRETKVRAVMPFVLPELSLPFLDERQTTILGSLAIQKIPRDLLLGIRRSFG